ncbi:hypothetical protein PHISP_04038 [Aspergillus sp. HF37]|nr:hypothetical protein PHISP_04038 [Aspergillus sp. HF37]
MDPSAQQLDPSKLTETDKKELNQFISNEAQKSTIQQSVHHLADNCWKKCINGKISAGRLESSEETCAANCVERWMDTNMSVLKHLEVLRGQ